MTILNAAYHNQFTILDFSDELSLLAIPPLNVDKIVSFQGYGGLKLEKMSVKFGKKKEKMPNLSKICEIALQIY